MLIIIVIIIMVIINIIIIIRVPYVTLHTLCTA